MEEARSNTRLFANLSLGLFIAGLLVPFLLVAIGGPGLGIGFGVVSEVLALFFGILGWADKRARVAVIGGMVLFVWAGAVAVINQGARKQDMQEAIKAQMEAEVSAQAYDSEPEDALEKK
tara:strand:+ start:298 stop:657 length:360 start_codon:yes stop_codon:yes gene_type:complete